MSSRTILGRVLAGAALLACGAVSSCGLLLDGAPAIGTTCDFDGDYSDCGQCVSDRCLDELDACCGGSCGDALERLDACAGDDDIEACEALRAAGDDEDDDGVEAELGRCIERRCSNECSTAASITSCSRVTLGCFCEVDEEPNDEACTTELGGCCADSGWPASGSCICAALDCEYYGNSCTCTRGGSGGSETSCDDKGFTFCCLTPEGCDCQDNWSCSELGYDDTETCWSGTAECSSEQQQLDHCDATEIDRDD